VPVLSDLTHDGLRDAFVRAKYAVMDQDKYSFSVARGEGAPFVVPRRGRFVHAEIVEAIYRNHFATAELRHEIEAQVQLEQAAAKAARPVVAAKPASDPSELK